MNDMVTQVMTVPLGLYAAAQAMQADTRGFAAARSHAEPELGLQTPKTLFAKVRASRSPICHWSGLIETRISFWRGRHA